MEETDLATLGSEAAVSPHRFPAVLRRPLVPLLALYAISVSLNLYRLGSIPPPWDHFEEWILKQPDFLSLSLTDLFHAVTVFLPNDTNQSINAFPWALLVRASTRLLGETPFAVRLPSAVISALSPVLLAVLVRMLLREGLAFATGLLLATSHFQLFFARSGGYLGVTLTVLLAIFLSSARVLQGRPLAWVPLTVLMILMPYFYSPIRYVSILALVPIGYMLVASHPFRAKHARYAAASAIAVCLCYLPHVVAWGGVRRAALEFYDARGEQLLFTQRSLQQKAWWNGAKEVWGVRLRDLYDFYVSGRGNRFFGWQHTDLFVRRIFLTLLGLGFARSLAQAWRSPKYLLPSLWSLLTCLPLLATTGVTPNRLYLGLPADTFLVTLGAATPSDLAARLFPRRLRWLAYLPFAGLVLWAGLQGVKCYFGSYSTP